MELNDVLAGQRIMWPLWQGYTIKKCRGVQYLVPDLDASEQPRLIWYNCAEMPGEMVASALELGRLITIDDPSRDYACTDFAARYGLLGLGADKDTTPVQHPDLRPSSRLVNSKGYGEELERFRNVFKSLYQRFSIIGRPEVLPLPKGSDLLALSGSIGFHMTGATRPQFSWEFSSLEAFLHFAYSALVSSPRKALKICKNCGQIYYNINPKSEFCSTRCRNYYNVKVFREKEKADVGENGR